MGASSGVPDRLARENHATLVALLVVSSTPLFAFVFHPPHLSVVTCIFPRIRHLSFYLPRLVSLVPFTFFSPCVHHLFISHPSFVIPNAFSRPLSYALRSSFILPYMSSLIPHHLPFITRTTSLAPPSLPLTPHLPFVAFCSLFFFSCPLSYIPRVAWHSAHSQRRLPPQPRLQPDNAHVFRRCQDEDAKLLCAALARNSSLTSIDVRMNDIPPELPELEEIEVRRSD